ncbi:MAG: TIGR03960 family B12-binding radical SAM protein [bacterium]
MSTRNYKEEIENILPLVSKPSRYTNSEWNSIHKTDIPDTQTICLCFPDLYELGISNVSLEILYTVINNRPGWSAERSYCPDTDMAALLNEKNIKLCSLESSKPLREFALVGFTLQQELCYTNVLHMLDLAGIPLKSADRNDLYPLIIGGGPCAVNPEPAADFFDLFVVGDGEDAIQDIMEALTRLRESGIPDKKKILHNLSSIPGVYVPCLYDVQYKADGTIASVKPLMPDVPAYIEKRRVDLETSLYPERPLVPFAQAVHDRYNLEIARGCMHTCRFCQASRIHHPVRERSVARLLELADKGLNSSGFEELALSALSSSEYTRMDELIHKLLERCRNKRISISLPSLRCNEKSLNLAKLTRGVKKTSLTFAPEAGSSRMRSIIDKKLDGENIPQVLHNAHRLGWKLIKLYFMYGLPWEKEVDIEAIVSLVAEAKKKNSMLNFNITISPFVPKAHTPFQWAAQDDQASLEKKKNMLYKKVPGNVRTHSHETALLEAVFARGDRKLSRVILAAYRKGCMFDLWRERFRFDWWMEAFNECGLDVGFYARRQRHETELFPWDHLTPPALKNMLFKEYAAAKNTALAEDPPFVTAVQPDRGVPLTDEETAFQKPGAARSVQRVRLRFTRFGPARFLSHLEQITVFRRLLRRADIPLAYTLGFHPQPRISFGPAISVGYSSDAEYVDVELVQKIDLSEITRLITAQLPEGFKLLQVKRIPVFFPSLESTVNQVLYHVEGIWPSSVDAQIQDFLHKDEFWIEKRKNKSIERVNVRSIVKNITHTNGSLEVLMDFGPKKNIKPTLLMKELFKLPEKEVETFHVHKVALYIGSSPKERREP